MSSTNQINTSPVLSNVADLQTIQITNSSFNDKTYTTQDNNQEELIDKTISLKHWQSHMLQKFIIIWLDPDINETNDKYHDIITQLRRIANAVQIFTEVNQCIDFIMNVPDGRFFFILSNNVDITVISLINDMSQVDSIYIFSNENIKSEQNVLTWKKVRGIFSDISIIFDYLRQNFRQYDQDLISTNIFSLDSTFDLDELDQSFMYSILLKEILLEINYDEKAKINFFKLYRDQYAHYQIDLNRIDEMEKNYYQYCPLWWYIKNPFIYSILNTALRTQNITSIIKMGFYLKDLHQQIEHVYSKVNRIEKLILYRGQSISNDEFEKMKKSKGGLLSFNNFLSTTIDRNIALRYANAARDDRHLTGILFDMEIDPLISKTPFAPLNGISDYSTSNDEILFSMHTVFRIGEMKEINNCLWNVKLIMTSDTDAQLERLTNRLREEIQGPTGLHRLGNLLIKMGQFDTAEETYNTLFEMLSDENSNELAYIYNQLGNILIEKGHLDKALSLLEKTLEIRCKSLPLNHPDLATTYNNIGSVYNKMGQYSKALSYYEKTLEIRLTSLPSNHPDLATTYNNIGSVYKKMGQYSKALSCYEKTLEMRLTSLPSNHPDLATTYNNIGLVYKKMGQYSKALSCYEKTLEIQQKTLTTNHPDLAVTFHSIGAVYHSIGEYSEALSYLEKSLQIKQISLPSDHPHLATTYNIIGLVYNSTGEYSKALSYFEKTLDIFNKTLQPNHPSYADTYNNIGSAYQAMGDYSKALCYYEKTLHIRQQTLPANHPDLAITYNNIGSIYNSMGEYSKALSYYKKTLEIQQISLTSDHPSLADTFNNMGLVYSSMNDYLNAIAYYKKALKIQQISLSNHPSLAITYNNIGQAHAAREHYSYALQYYQDALKIQEKVLPSNHLSLAETYNNVGEMYRLIGNCSDALTYYTKTLNIQEKVLSSDHLSLAITYSNMGQVYSCMKQYKKGLSSMNKALEIQSKSLPSNHPSLAMNHYNMAILLQGLEQYTDAVTHASKAVDIISHSIESNQLQAQKYQQYLNDLMAIVSGDDDMHKKKENELWTYPVLLAPYSLQESRLYSILKNITDGYLMPPIQIDKCIDKMRSNHTIKDLVIEISSIPENERDHIFKNISSIDSIEYVYLLGKPPETKQKWKKIFSQFNKVCIYCEDEEQLVIQLVLNMTSNCRVSANELIKTGDNDTAREYFQRGMDLYKRLSKFIDTIRHKES